MGDEISVVWFKRDLRLADHAALSAAARAGAVLPLVIVEPDYWRLADVSHRHYAFLAGCIEDLAAAIAAAGGRLLVRVGPAVEVLEALRRRLGGFSLWSHEETGNRWTHARDRAVRRWARGQGVTWTELRNFGVIRGPALNRDRWAAQWDRMMAAPSLPPPRGIAWATPPEGVAAACVPAAAALGLAPDGLRHGQAPGRAAALETLGSFLARRGEDYTRAMSSPVSGEAACSRLSPYLAYGCLSIREAAQAAWRRQREVPAASRWGRRCARSSPGCTGIAISSRSLRPSRRRSGGLSRGYMRGCGRRPIRRASPPGRRGGRVIPSSMRRCAISRRMDGSISACGRC
ncbi:unnamed protein product [Acidocella sp. C78]|nr:unnamed protein product [Acidocella sp. C78]